jgi:hypothetical protein
VLRHQIAVLERQLGSTKGTVHHAGPGVPCGAAARPMTRGAVPDMASGAPCLTSPI